MALSVDPISASFPCSGGNKTMNLSNTTENRLAFKVKTSNNEFYRVRPVFGFIAAQATTKLEVFRMAGPAKQDKMVVQWAEVLDEETDAKAPFVAGAQAGELVIELSTAQDRPS